MSVVWRVLSIESILLGIVLGIDSISKSWYRPSTNAQWNIPVNETLKCRVCILIGNMILLSFFFIIFPFSFQWIVTKLSKSGEASQILRNVHHDMISVSSRLQAWKTCLSIQILPFKIARRIENANGFVPQQLCFRDWTWEIFWPYFIFMID